MEDLISNGAGAILLMAFAFGDASVGRSAPLHPPRGTGCERVMTLSRSPGVGLAGIWVPDDAGCFLRNLVSDDAGTVLLRFFVPDDAGVGRSAPLHPLG